ncbi:MAG: efflux RND transporter periplasmic adaptor subunit [Pseudomonadales bacterium]|nr:efflux RND transporter periplasmic adaptor subunit [Pseudomonadales bacterium]
MSNKSLIAVFFTIAMVVWLFSGELVSNTVTAAEDDAPRTAVEIPTVRGVESIATDRQLYLEVRGQTQANRQVQIRAEVSGRIEALPAVKGTIVKKGDLLCKIAVDTRQSDLEEARAALQSAQLEYDGILDLKRRSLQSDINVARAKAALESARSRVKGAELALQKTEMLAPFDAVVETQPVEIGDFLGTGQVCVALMEIDPMLVVGQVAERNISHIALGDTVKVALITGDEFEGTVSFIGRSPDAATRTYPIEVTVHDLEHRMRAGMTADMRVPVGNEQAHLISPASLVLDDEGKVGVRIVDRNNIVRFVVVSIIGEAKEGVWVKGLPASVKLITIGQEEVFDGQVVNIDLTPLESVVRT